MNENVEVIRNCGINGHRIKTLEDNLKEGFIEMKGEVNHLRKEVKDVHEQNGNQNELLAKFDTMIEFIIKDREDQKEDKKEQKELNKRTIDTLESMNGNLIVLNSDVDSIKGEVATLKKKQVTQEDNANINWQVLLKNNLSKILNTIIYGALLSGAYYLISNL